MLRSWPTASGVSVSGKVTLSRSGRTGSAFGQARQAVLAHVLGRAVVGDLDHEPASPDRRDTGTERVCESDSTRGSSTRRMPPS